MKHTSIAVALIIAFPVLAAAQITSQNADCEQTAKSLEAKASKILQTFDKKSYEQFAADDVVIINSDGSRETKQQQAASFIRPPEMGSLSFTTKDVKVRVCTETSIVVTGTDIIKASKKGSKETLDASWWFTRIYEKRETQWRLVYNQLTTFSD